MNDLTKLHIPSQRSILCSFGRDVASLCLLMLLLPTGQHPPKPARRSSSQLANSNQPYQHLRIWHKARVTFRPCTVSFLPSALSLGTSDLKSPSWCPWHSALHHKKSPSKTVYIEMDATGVWVNEEKLRKSELLDAKQWSRQKARKRG